jgi:hypothetical protein
LAPDFYSQGHVETEKVLTQLKENQAALDRAIERWAELEQQQQSYRRSPS